MKRIVLVRHAKSSWDYGVSDRERPLKPRGRQDAELVAKQFVGKSKVPDYIFSSPAKRAMETCKIFTSVLNYPFENINIEEKLYDFGGVGVIGFVKNLSNNVNEIMIFGHNAAFTNIVNDFGSTYIDNLPTSGLVEIEFDIQNWMELETGKTRQIIIPKELR
ncbi:SixA phosphatase family protein [Winogradskyella aurantia]|uniref:Histidine phosphatase family protein n=1 Tax=Winogradskyella aurantia TaxID=1915063 RepID=A0A265UTS9_9FLAO|nr:histidine phosphatase family protein [Winogradskyella aurantia]OZV68711.1 histidine phosphatase family protein [Winogradskyella aurantia]